MIRWVALPFLAFSLLVSPGSFGESAGRVPVPHSQKIYITSAFNCPVYWRNRRVAILRKGTPALIVSSTKGWILVRFRTGGRNVVGWIKR